jgi:mono/diheme cytochrome c family protein
LLFLFSIWRVLPHAMSEYASLSQVSDAKPSPCIRFFLVTHRALPRRSKATKAQMYREVFMDKLLGALAIGTAMFVTIGAFATRSSTPTASRRSGWVGATSVDATQTNKATKPEIDRGRYLVEEVAKCPECHTPRNDRGELRQDAWLNGATIWIRPVAPIPNWADHVPALAGLPSFTEEQGERILEKGTGPEGEQLRPPMHIYHMKHEDAKAIIAYLKSLPRSSQTN